MKGRNEATGRYISHKSLAFLIGRSIKTKGIGSLMFFQKPLGVKLKTFGTDLKVAINKDIQDVLTKIKFD